VDQRKAHSPPMTTAPIPRNPIQGQDRFYEYQAAQCTVELSSDPGNDLTGDIHIGTRSVFMYVLAGAIGRGRRSHARAVMRQNARISRSTAPAGGTAHRGVGCCRLNVGMPKPTETEVKC